MSYKMTDENQTFQVDDLVQTVRNNKIKDGKVIAVNPPKVNRSTYNQDSYYKLSVIEKNETSFTYDVLWNSGETSKDLLEWSNGDYLEVQDSELERKFRLESLKIMSKIEEKAVAAVSLLNEATAISDQYGIPFRSPLAITDNAYIPSTMSTKFPGLEKEQLERLCGIYSEYGYSGWQTSYC